VALLKNKNKNELKARDLYYGRYRQESVGIHYFRTG
jgi:hypothetical protein